MEKGLSGRVLHALKKDESQSSFVLVVEDLYDPSMGVVVSQVDHTEQHAVFEIQSTVQIEDSLIAETLKISCAAKSDKFLIPKQEYNRIVNEIFKNHEENNKQEKDESYSSSSQESVSDSDDNSEEDSLYANLNAKVKSYEHDSENNKSQRKGRGRPKGSKNKKTLLKEEQSRSGVVNKGMHLHDILSGTIKRGKGRPKGSKNKPKLPVPVVVKKEYDENTPFVGKRGKGRPKGSKNKIKVMEPVPEYSENRIKRGRGRPPGARNKPASSPEVSSVKHESDSESKFEWQRVPREQIQQIQCCKRCEQRKLRFQILEGRKYFEVELENLKDPFADFGLENKRNLGLQIVQENDPERLESLLTRKDEHQTIFRPPWNVDHIIERTPYEVKTKKQYLSQTGKEGIYVLLHDCSFKKEVWWRKLGVERIIESICVEEQSSHTLNMLLEESKEFKAEIYNLLPHILRCGNHYVAEMLLKKILQTPASNKYNYSEEHYDLLIGNLLKINQYKKFKLIKPNQGANFCSPIHCAAITANPQFLVKLLELFTDVVNVQDSMLKKPIHYASACRSPVNLKVLVESGADLREFDKKKMTPLMIACYFGISENVEYILEKVREPSYINFRSLEGFSALHYAIMKSHEQCVDLLLNDPYVRCDCIDSKDSKELDVFHIASWSDNLFILDKLLKKWGSYLPNSVDKFKKNPAVYAIRNHNNEVLYKLLASRCKPFKADSTLNTLLHYAAAYGNVEGILMLLRNGVTQTKNKRNYYPWQIAIMKGHLGCAKLLENHPFEFKLDPLYTLLGIIRGTQQYFNCIRYMAQKFCPNIKYQDPSTGNSYLHLVCAISSQEYVRQRSHEVYLTNEEIREEFNEAQHFLIEFFKEKGLTGDIENKKKQSPLRLCIENVNLIGIHKLLTGKICFQLESAEGGTIMHRLSNLACKGISEMEFVESKLKEATINDLRVNLKNFDQSGFDFLLYFVKNFTETVKSTFKKWVSKGVAQGMPQGQAEETAFTEFVQFQAKFMKLVAYLIEQGCDVNRQVADKKLDSSENYQRWGIQHFLMRFPSLKLIEFFTNNKHKIRYFNAQNNSGKTALHLFCKHIVGGNLLQTEVYELPDPYQAHKVLEYLLSNGLNPNTTDFDKSLPILYAALNNQYQFIRILIQNKSEINQKNAKNQVPLCEIIKNHRSYTFKEIEDILKRGAKPNFEDMDKRNALHHLVRCSTNFDSSPEICRLLLDHNAKVNSLDKFNRSPIFYCFDPDDEESEPNDKVELLQVMINLPDINLNLLDVFMRSVVHYACRKNYFFSILYLLDRNINIDSLDLEKNTPLAICLKERNLDQAAFIIKKGVRYGFVSEQRQGRIQKLSYFTYAINNLSVGICFMLLDYGYPIQKALEEVPNTAFKEVLKQKYIR